MTRVRVDGYPGPGSRQITESWTQHVEILTKEDLKDKAPDWYLVLFGDRLGHAIHSKLVVLGSPVGSVVFGRAWTGCWKLTLWPDDLARSHFARLLISHQTLAHYAESLDSAVSGLSRKVTVVDARRVRARLGESPWGKSAWLVLKMLLREKLDLGLCRALDGYANIDRAVMLPWLQPTATRATRLWALRELEPAAVRFALLQRAGRFSASSLPQASQKLLEAIDDREPLRNHCCAMLALTSAQVRWFNIVAGNPRTPASLLPELCTIVAHLPPEVRPQTDTELRAKKSLLQLVSEHYRILFSPAFERRLPPPATPEHREAFRKSCIPLFKQTTLKSESELKGRSHILTWLSQLGAEEFVTAHFALSSIGFAKRENLFALIDDWINSPVQALPLFVEETSKSADQAWALTSAEKEAGSPAIRANPQKWASETIHGNGGTMYFWPTSSVEMKSIGQTFRNCLAGHQGRAYWLYVATGQQIFVAITTRFGIQKFQSLVAFSMTQGPNETVRVAIEQHCGTRNAPPPKSHVPIAGRLLTRIETDLHESGWAPQMLRRLIELRAMVETAASDISGWRSRQIDASCRSALLRTQFRSEH